MDDPVQENSDKQKFIELHDSEKVFIVNVEVGGLRINNTYVKQNIIVS